MNRESLASSHGSVKIQLTEYMEWFASPREGTNGSSLQPVVMGMDEKLLHQAEALMSWGMREEKPLNDINSSIEIGR